MTRGLVGGFLVLSLAGCAVIDASRVRQMSSLDSDGYVHFLQLQAGSRRALRP